MALNESRWLKGKHEEYSVEQEDTTRGNPIVEAIFKPRWNVPLLSAYTSAVGRAARKADVGVEKRSEKLKRKGILEEYNVQSMRHGVRKTKKVAKGEGGIVGYPKAMDMASYMPLIGDPETGKYSLFDVVLAGAEAVPIYKGYEKGVEGLLKHLTKPTKKKYEKKLKKVLKKGGKEKLKAAKKWQKEWINDPETFLRQSGLRANDPETFMFGRFAGGRDEKFLRLARKPNMSRSRMKKEGFAEEWDAYIKYKDEMTKEFDRLNIREDLQYKFSEETGKFQRRPDETLNEFRTRELVRKGGLSKSSLNYLIDPDQVKFGFTPIGKEQGLSGVYRPPYSVGTINDMIVRGEKRIKGRYFEQVEVSPFTKDIESVAVHELQHFITKGDENISNIVKVSIEALKRGDEKSLIRIWKENNLKTFSKKGYVKASKASDSEISHTVRYLADRTEIQARLQQIRHSLGLKPGQKVTSKDLKGRLKSQEGYSSYRQLKDVLGEDNIIKALNTLPAILPMTTEESLFNQWDKEDNPF
jgi:hypothetical protein